MFDPSPAAFPVLLLATGAFAGILPGLLGIGGGIFLIPVPMIIFRGFEVSDAAIMQLCVGASTAAIAAPSIRSVWPHHRHGAVQLGILRGWAPGLAAGAVLGVVTATSLKSGTPMLVFGTLAALVGGCMLAGNPKWRIAGSLPGPQVHVPYSGAMGFVCAMTGIGGGTPVNRAIAASAGFGLLISLPAAVPCLLAAPADGTVPAFAAITAMTFLTVPLGARLTHVLPAAKLRKVFALFIILAALNMLRNALFRRRRFQWPQRPPPIPPSSAPPRPAA
ncbi:sulfite exporter TauE/SafE family protein [Mangrovicoccus ximenensis]|uniref:sulfite exporter TauE/SafE family protein n=1 Tax=Mangrovicoccus ximenensis TaxID=1911570 RepID=UPI000D3B4F21|nr:sulfite exporter TauE/SafE family protein [Mangrovicoccus ximenensis]